MRSVCFIMLLIAQAASLFAYQDTSLNKSISQPMGESRDKSI